MSSTSAFPPEWLKERIEAWAPQHLKYRDGRNDLYSELHTYEENVYTSVLASIYFAHLSERERLKARNHEQWYWKEREKLVKQLGDISKHDLVREGPNIESVVFYEPHEVDCQHGRRRNRCIAIREKLQILEQAERLLAEKHSQAWIPLLNRWRKRVPELARELKQEGVDTSKHRPDDFCALDFREPVDARARAETGVWRPPGTAGPPHKHLQNLLLETVAECLHRAGASRRRACELVARILVYCFGTNKPVAELDLSEALERQWRALREKPR